MKVKLINVADYDLKEDKISEISYETFVNLCGGFKNEEVTKENLSSVRLFKSIKEFSNLSQEEMEEFDTSKNVCVLTNGNFCVFLKEDKTTKKG